MKPFDDFKKILAETARALEREGKNVYRIPDSGEQLLVKAGTEDARLRQENDKNNPEQAVVQSVVTIDGQEYLVCLR